MEDFKIKGLQNNMQAILRLCIHNNAMITALSKMLVESTGKDEEDREWLLNLLNDERESAQTLIVQNLYVLLGDLDLGDLLRGK